MDLLLSTVGSENQMWSLHRRIRVDSFSGTDLSTILLSWIQISSNNMSWVCVCINRNIWDAGTKVSYNTTTVTGSITLLQLHDMHPFRRSPVHHASCCVAPNKMINIASLRNISCIKSTLMVITRQQNIISFKITLWWPTCHFVFLGHVSHGWSCERPSQLADTRVRVWQFDGKHKRKNATQLTY